MIVKSNVFTNFQNIIKFLGKNVYYVVINKFQSQGNQHDHDLL